MVQSCAIRWVWIALLGAGVLGGVATVVGATPVEELTKRLPDGVVAFVGTSGGDALKGEFEKTSLGRIWNDPGVRSFVQAIKTQALAKMQEKGTGPNEIKQADMVAGMAALVAGRPLIAGVAPLPGPTQIKEKPPVYGFLILDAGTQKAQFEELVKKLETMAGAESIADVDVGPVKMRGPKGQKDLPLYWGWSGNYLIVAANDAAGAALQYVQKPRAAVPAYLQKVTGGEALVVHADLQKTISLVNTAARQNDPKAADTITAVLRELGLSGMRTLTVRAGFAGPDVVFGSLLEVPGPRTGLLAALKPVDPALMDMVDARAVTAGAANLDLAGMYDTILRAIKTSSAQAGANVEKGLANFESQTKLSVRKDLLGSLAGPAVFYTLGAGAAPEAPMGGGAVALLKLKDAELFEKTLTSLGDFLAARSKGQFQASAQKREDGRTVHTWMIPQLAMMQVMPAWSVANGYAVISSNAGVHDTVVKQMAATGAQRKSIRDTPGFKEVAAKLPANVVTLNYADSRTQYTQMMTGLQQFWPMASMFAAQAGLQLPPTLPSLSEIIKDMKPSLRSRWLDAEGLHMQYRGPGLDVSLSSVGGAAVGMAVVMPALAKAREQARSAASMSNLKQIGLGLIMYADDHQGNWPADLEQAKSYWPNARVLESPRKPKDFAGPSYIYLSGQPKTIDPGNVVVYENPGYCTDKINVLFADGHVQAMKPEAFRNALQETCARLGKPMPEIKFKGEDNARSLRPFSPGKSPQP